MNLSEQLGVALKEASVIFTKSEIEKLLAPVYRKMDKVKSDADYGKFLDSFGEYADLADKYFSPDLHSTADKLHYQQGMDKQVPPFLEFLKENY